jgi:VWFA-related protein
MSYSRRKPSNSPRISRQRRRVMVTTLLAFFSLISLALAQPGTQQKPEAQSSKKDAEEIVRISTNLVQVDVIVSDQKGNHVQDLTEADFAIEVDSKSYPITFFRSMVIPPQATYKTTAPTRASPNIPYGATRMLRPEDVKRTIAFVIDDGGLAFDSFVRMREALKKFVTEQMEEGDLVAIIRTGVNSNLLGKFTTDRQMLLTSIERLKWGVQLTTLGDLPGMSQGEQDSLNNSFESFSTMGRINSLRTAARSLRELPGRKVAILLSDGFRLFTEGDNQPMIDRMQRVIDEAHRGGVAFYAIDTKGLTVDGPGPGPIVFNGQPSGRMPSNNAYRMASDRRFYLREGLIYLAKETGGLATFNNNDLTASINKSLGDNRSYYLLGFDPEDELFNGRFRSLKVKVLKKGLDARTRSGFLGKADASTSGQPKTRSQEITNALFSPFLAREIPLEMNAMFFTTADRQPVVRTTLHFDCTPLAFQAAEGEKKAATLELIAISFDDNGNPVDQQERNFTVTLDPTAMKRALGEGLVYQVDFNAPKPGVYQMRAVLRETATGKLGTATQLMQIPDLAKASLAMSGIFLAGTGPATNEFAGMRQYATNSELHYAALVYSPTFDRARQGYQLTSRIEIVKAGKVIHQSTPRPVEAPGEQVAELQVGGRLQLNGLEPGDYLLQLVVTDALAPGKGARAGQWIDFSVR